MVEVSEGLIEGWSQFDVEVDAVSQQCSPYASGIVKTHDCQSNNLKCWICIIGNHLSQRTHLLLLFINLNKTGTKRQIRRSLINYDNFKLIELSNRFYMSYTNRYFEFPFGLIVIQSSTEGYYYRHGKSEATLFRLNALQTLNFLCESFILSQTLLQLYF